MEIDFILQKICQKLSSKLLNTIPNLIDVAKGIRTDYKGWKCFYLNKEK